MRDEAFLDATGCTQIFGPVEEIGRSIKRDILHELQLVASVGVAPNKFLAKLASDLDKPDGFTVIAPENVQQVLDPLPVSRIWGVGKVTNEKFARIGVQTIGQLRQLDPQRLETLFGKSGQHFHQLARGIDDRAVVADRAAKSISHETTFPVDVRDMDVLRAWLLELTEHVAQRLRHNSLTGRTVTLKVRYSDFDTVTRSSRLAEPSNVTRILWDTALQLLTQKLPQRPLVVRLLGMGVTGLQAEGAIQQTLFDEDASTDTDQTDKDRKLDQLTDQIRGTFGATSLRRASTVQHNATHRSQPRPE